MLMMTGHGELTFIYENQFQSPLSLSFGLAEQRAEVIIQRKRLSYGGSGYYTVYYIIQSV